MRFASPFQPTLANDPLSPPPLPPSIIPSRDRSAAKRAILTNEASLGVSAALTPSTPTTIRPTATRATQQPENNALGPSQTRKDGLPQLGPGIPRAALPPLGPGIPRGLTPLPSHSPSSLTAERWESGATTAKLARSRRNSSHGVINLDIPSFEDDLGWVDAQPTPVEHMPAVVANASATPATPAFINRPSPTTRSRSKSNASQGRSAWASRLAQDAESAFPPLQEEHPTTPIPHFEPQFSGTPRSIQSDRRHFVSAARMRGNNGTSHSNNSSTSSLSHNHAHQPALSLDGSATKDDRLQLNTNQLPLPLPIARAHSASAEAIPPLEQILPLEASAGLGAALVSHKPGLNRQASVAVMETVPQLTRPGVSRGRSGSSASGLVERSIPELKDVLKASLVYELPAACADVPPTDTGLEFGASSGHARPSAAFSIGRCSTNTSVYPHIQSPS